MCSGPTPGRHATSSTTTTPAGGHTQTTEETWMKMNWSHGVRTSEFLLCGVVVFGGVIWSLVFREGAGLYAAGVAAVGYAVTRSHTKRSPVQFGSER